MKKVALFLCFGCMFICPKVFDHGDLHERIVAITEEIKKTPDSAYLYVKRGKLFFQHETYKKSIKDLKYSIKLGYYSPEQQFILAKSNFKLKKLKKSLGLINSLLEEDSLNVRYFKFKAQLLFADEKFEESAINFESVILYSKKTFPENYLDASLAWQYSDNVVGIKNSKEIIKKGLNTIGPLTVFYDRLIEIAKREQAFEEAISYQNLVVGMSNRKEKAYFELYKLYKLNNEHDKAKESLNFAKIHLRKLPERIKNTTFVKSLKEDIEREEKITLTNKS